MVSVDPSRNCGVSPAGALNERPSGLAVLSHETVAAEHSTAKANFQRNIEPHTIASLFHTGVTTGLPKLARRTHLNEAYQGWVVSNYAGDRCNDTILCGLPLFHVNACIVTGLAAFAAAAHVLLATSEGYRNKTFCLVSGRRWSATGSQPFPEYRHFMPGSLISRAGTPVYTSSMQAVRTWPQRPE